jgi:hypothetical protein
MKDDFETRSMYVASSELEFVNSWKENPLCGDASYVVDPCSLNTFRLSWAERKCSIINSQTFAACHSKVGPQGPHAQSPGVPGSVCHNGKPDKVLPPERPGGRVQRGLSPLTLWGVQQHQASIH